MDQSQILMRHQIVGVVGDDLADQRQDFVAPAEQIEDKALVGEDSACPRIEALGQLDLAQGGGDVAGVQERHALAGLRIAW